MKVFTMLKKKDYPEKGYRRSNKLHCILGLDLETLRNFPIFINMYPVQENTRESRRTKSSKIHREFVKINKNPNKVRREFVKINKQKKRKQLIFFKYFKIN